MNTQLQNMKMHQRLKAAAASILALAWTASTYAYTDGRVTFASDAPFSGGYAHSMSADTAEDLFTLSGWADANATTPANLWNWWILLGVDSGTGNGALIDGNESVTIQLDKSVGVSMLFFTYTGGNGSGSGNLARISISGFTSDPGASCVPTSVQRITAFNYSAGTLSFDYLDDGGGSDTGQLLFASPAASAGKSLILTVAASPNGNATSAFAGLRAMNIQEAFGGPQVQPSYISNNSSSSFISADSKLTIKGFSDLNATVPANLGRYLDECFGIAGPNTVSGNSSVSLQFASGFGLARLDSRYSGGTLTISGFLSDPGLVDISSGSTSSSYSSGTLTITISDGGVHPLYFTNRAASLGQTLILTDTTSQFGIGGVGYASAKTIMAPDIPNEVSSTYTTPDNLVTLNGYADTPGTIPANLHETHNWFGISGGVNSQSIDGSESLSVQLANGVGLAGLGTKYTYGQVVISGFTSDPGFYDPSGLATGVAYSSGTLSYAINTPHSPEVVVSFTNPGASAGQTLSLHTDGSGNSQLTLTRLTYATAVVPVTLRIVKSGDNVILTWPSGTLQQSTDVSGGYSDLPTATSPYTNAITGPQKYFRVKVQ
jgi:hypothetical protein